MIEHDEPLASMTHPSTAHDHRKKPVIIQAWL